jgi:hypothetical protein
MTFLAPLGLLALLALPIIFFLHFRRERLRRVAVSSLMLWQQIAPTTGKNRKLILPFTLLLLLHLLIAAALALALSQPQWLGALLNNSQQHVVVVVDTSTSMAAREGFGSTRLDMARDQVRNIVDGLGSSGSMSLVAAGTQARLLTSGGAGNRAGLLVALDDLEAAGTGTDIAGALTLGQVAARNAAQDQAGGAARFVVLSDLDPPPEMSLPAERVEWLRVGDTTDNRAVVALAARARRGGSAGYDVYTRVVNYNENPTSTAVRLFADGELLNVRSVDLQGNGEAELTWDLPAGISVLRAELEDDDALSVDNVARLSLTQTRPVQVLLVSDAAISLNRVLQVIPGVQVEVLHPAGYADYALRDQADLTIFDGFLPNEWPVGGVLVVNPPVGEHPLLNVAAPPPGAEDGSSSQLYGPVQLAASASDMAENPLRGLSLSGVDFGTLPRVQPPDWARVLLAAGDTPLVMRGQTGESTVAIWSFDLRQGNLITRLAFPLLVARTVEDLTVPPPPGSLLVGETLVWQPSPRAESLEIRGPAEAEDAAQNSIAISRTVYIEGLMEPGLYTIVESADDEIIYEGQVAVNAGSPLESDIRPHTLPETDAPVLALDAAPDTEGQQAAARGAAEPLWPWLAVAALVLISIEWLYVHWR